MAEAVRKGLEFGVHLGDSGGGVPVTHSPTWGRDGPSQTC